MNASEIETLVNVAVCVKRVMDVSLIKPDPTTRAPVTTDVAYKISDFDKNAIEEAIRIKEKSGGKVIIFTVGPTESKTTLGEGLAMGADQTVIINPGGVEGLEPHIVASALASGIKKYGPFDIIVCGEGSVDEYNGQVGPMISEILGVPRLTYATKLDVKQGSVSIERSLGDETEVVEAALPALVTVGMEINAPRYPTLLQLVASKKKPVSEVKLADLGITPDQKRVKTGEVVAPLTSRKKTVLEGDPDSVAGALLAHLRSEGVLKI